MNKGTFIDALSLIDSELVESAEKYEEKSDAAAFKKPALIASAIVAATMVAGAVVLGPFVRRSENADTETEAPCQSTPVETPFLPPVIQQYIVGKNIPSTGFENEAEYIQPFSEPTLEELYSDQIFARLLPRKLPDCCLFYRSYMTENENVEDRYLHLTFRDDAASFTSGFASENGSEFEIKISRLENNVRPADPNDPQTYRVSLFYEALDKGLLGDQLPNVFRPFRTEDLTREIVADKIFVMGDHCAADISIICVDHVVSYRYIGTRISVDEIYDIIASSQVFPEDMFG